MSDVSIASSGLPAVSAWRAVDAITVGADGASASASSNVAEETPVAFRYNGFAHAVMMATPEALADFALGFSHTEGVIDAADDIASLAIGERDDGLALDITLSPQVLHRYLAGRRVRRLSGNTSCGLCGAEDLRDVHRPTRRLPMPQHPYVGQVQVSLDALRAFQPLSRLTRGAHAAAWIGGEGAIAAVREDVGRHNALDKLIGAGLAGAFAADDGFCLITSRCSFEMVQKAVRAGYATLVAAAAPTALAIRTAHAAGLTLFSLDRGRGQLLYTAPHVKETASCR
jgi:FdhD protein